MAAAQERRRQEARDRLAGKLVEAARQMLENGDGYAAIALLERDGSSHPLVSEALAGIRATVAEQEERARQDAERRRQEEEARQRAELEAARKLEEARQAEEQRKRDEERRVREAEIARRREEFATLVNAAENALGASDPEQATLLLKRADLVGRVEDSGLAKRAEAVRAEAERLERERQAREAAEQRAREEARRREDEERRRAEEARQRAEEARRRKELEAERAEAARQAEQARREEEEARNREAAVTTILSRERNEAPEAALTLLEDALTLAPGDRRVEARIKQRNADLERQRLEVELQRQVAEAVSAITAALDRQDLDEAERLIRDGERQFAVPPFHDVRRTYESLRRTEARARREAAEAEQREQDRQAREAAEQRAREEAERARLEREEQARQAREAKEAKERVARERKEHAQQEKEEAAESGEKPAWSRYGAAAAVAALLIGGASWVLWPDAGSEPAPAAPIAGGGPPVSPSPLPNPGGARRCRRPPLRQPTSPSDRGNAPGPRGGDPNAAGRGRQGNLPETPPPAGETPAERAAREQAEREQQAREQLVKDQLAKEQLAKDQARQGPAREGATRQGPGGEGAGGAGPGGTRAGGTRAGGAGGGGARARRHPATARSVRRRLQRAGRTPAAPARRGVPRHSGTTAHQIGATAAVEPADRRVGGLADGHGQRNAELRIRLEPGRRGPHRLWSVELEAAEERRHLDRGAPVTCQAARRAAGDDHREGVVPAAAPDQNT